MTFEELWREVQGLPEMAKIQVPATLSESTKKRLCKYSPEDVAAIVAEAIEEVNCGAVAPLDELIRKKL